MGNRYKVIENVLFPLDGSQGIVDANGDNYHGIPFMAENPSAKMVPVEIDASGNLKTTAQITGDVNVDPGAADTSGYIGKASGTNGDFTTAYAAATQIALSDLPAEVGSITADDIFAIVQIDTNGAVLNTYTRDDVTIVCSGTDPTTVTVTGATFGATDTFVVYTNINRRVELLGYSRAQNVLLTMDPAPFASGHISDPSIDVLLDDDPTSEESAPIYIGDCDKVSFLIKSDVTAVGDAPQVTYTFEVADIDETEYIPCDVVMTDDGEDAPVASIVHAADAEETAYFANGFTASYLKVIATGANTDVDDTVACLVFTELKKG